MTLYYILSKLSNILTKRPVFCMFFGVHIACSKYIFLYELPSLLWSVQCILISSLSCIQNKKQAGYHVNIVITILHVFPFYTLARFLYQLATVGSLHRTHICEPILKFLRRIGSPKPVLNIGKLNNRLNTHGDVDKSLSDTFDSIVKL